MVHFSMVELLIRLCVLRCVSTESADPRLFLQSTRRFSSSCLMYLKTGEIDRSSGERGKNVLAHADQELFFSTWKFDSFSPSLELNPRIA